MRWSVTDTDFHNENNDISIPPVVFGFSLQWLSAGLK